MYEAASLIVGVVLLFGIPAWAARETWPRHPVAAIAGALVAVAAWCALCLWLAVG